MKKIRKILLTQLLVLCCGICAGARVPSLSLDSIAEWGRFPRFCVNTYRWGDRFFNSYDSTYVVGTGRKFNIKYRTELYTDFYNFRFDNEERTNMMLMSDPTVTGGFWLTYMAVSLGYDLNLGKYVGGNLTTSKRFNFQFNCSLFTAELFYLSNDQGTKITRFGHSGESEGMRLDFSGLDNSIWGASVYYFFNHRHYSQAATFAFSKLQKKSSGSFFAGLTYTKLAFKFDFRGLPADMLEYIPLEEYDYIYRARNSNYGFRLGYGYNLVLPHGWTLGISESAAMGLRAGRLLNFNERRYSFSLYNYLKASGVYNHHNWFAGMVFKIENGLIYDKKSAMIGSNLNVELSVGYRFNLW